MAQTSNDYDKLNRLMNDSGTVLRPNGRVNTWYRAPMSIAGPPLDPEEVSYALGRLIAADGIHSRWQRLALMAMLSITLIVLKLSCGFYKQTLNCIALLVESLSIAAMSVSDIS